LDNLFFDFIDLAKELQSKVVVAENVKGLLLGNAKSYVRKIYKEFDKAGYYCQHWLLDASKMGVPQRRERVFFVCLRKDLAEPFLKQMDLFTVAPELKLEFNEPVIIYSDFADYGGVNISEYAKKAWDNRGLGDNNIADSKARCGMKVSDMNTSYIYDHKTPPTLTSKGASGSLLFSKPIRLSKSEFCKIGSYPIDYNFTANNWGYLIGMSVPPVMTAQIATEIYNQWLCKIQRRNKD
jgi:DNA (cytosine-5)-methyltransferase 1